MEIKRFNDISIGTIFKYPNSDKKFIKFANARPDTLPHQQAPNSYGLFNNHYFSISANAPVEIIKEAIDFDDTRLEILQ